MRAFFTEEILDVASELKLEGETFQHIKVVRLRANEEILLLDGKGKCAYATFKSLEKKYAVVEINRVETKKPIANRAIAIGLVKKDALDLCLKMAVELGFNRIIPVQSRFAQSYELNNERAQRLLIQALEQSNSPWLPKLENPISFASLVENCADYQDVVVMGMSVGHACESLPPLGPSVLGIIGPEGGFHPEEEQSLSTLKNSSAIHLPCPILRTPTALAALAGVIFTKQRLLD